MGFKTNYFVMNTAKKVLMVLIIVFMLPGALLFYYFGKKSSNSKLKYLLNRADTKLRWQVFLRAFMQSYLSFIFSAMLNIYTLDWSNYQRLSLNTVGILFTVGIMFLPVLIFNII